MASGSSTAAGGARTFVGFGFGAIQAGLFLHEAHRCGEFRRLVVAEVVPEVVRSIRAAGGTFALNIARRDGIERVQVGPIEIHDPATSAGREALVAAIAEACELATAVPSVDVYIAGGPGSIHRLLAAGLRRKAASGGGPAVIYTAENNNRAAAILRRAVEEALAEAGGPPDAAGVLADVRFADTVIGKMSGVITDAGEIAALSLATVTPEDTRAFLVEEFNRILISRIDLGGGFSRGLSVFEEKDDLEPFEEAKLYGHNAVHALAAYAGGLAGVTRIAELASVPGALPLLRAALIDESGAALIARHRGVDPLFTWEGFRRYAGDLLERMMNPYLRDTVERVGRDPRRKLGWEDRLAGTMRLALAGGIVPHRYALGAAAALVRLEPALLADRRAGGPGREGDREAIARILLELWRDGGGERASAAARRDREEMIDLVALGLRRLRAWKSGEVSDLELLVHRDRF